MEGPASWWRLEDGWLYHHPSGVGAAPPNKGMKQTSVERIGRSQLIPGVLRTLVERGLSVLPGVAVIWVLALGTSNAAGTTQFPGSQSQVSSPDRRFALVWVPADDAPGGKHVLKLGGASGPQRVILEFERWVRVAWSPDSRHIAIVKGVGSDASESSVYPTDGKPPISVWAALRSQQGTSVESLVAGADHCYVEADRWLDAATLSVRVWGYGGSRPFDKRFRVSLSE